MLRARTVTGIAVTALLAAVPDVHAQAQGGAGRRVFETRCAVCHGNDGHGGDTGPSIVYRLPLLKDAEVIALLQGGRPAKGMPPQPMPVADRTALIRYLRGIERREPPLTRATIQTTDGRTLDGVVLERGVRRSAAADRRQARAPAAAIGRRSSGPVDLRDRTGRPTTASPAATATRR